MKNLLLFVIAIILFCFFLPIAIVYNFLDTTFSLFGRLAIAIDRAGNVLLDNLFNDIMIKKGNEFGNGEETISFVLGKNIHTNNLTKTGRALCWLLGVIDKDHCNKTYKNKIRE